MENEKKYCPMNPSTDEVLHCCENKCAWWDEDAQACSVTVIAKAAKKTRKTNPVLEGYA